MTSQYSNSNHVISNTTYFPINIYDDQNLTRVFTDGGGIYRYRTESKDKLISIEPAIFNPNYEYNGQAIIFDPNQYGVFVNQDFALSIKILSQILRPLSIANKLPCLALSIK